MTEKEDMTVEESYQKSLSKALYKIELLIIKVIPYLLAGFYLLNTILSYFNIEAVILSYLAGVSLLPLLFFYITSFVFKFCIYHRLPIYYIFVNWFIVVLNYEFDIVKNNEFTYLVCFITAGITILLIVYFKFKEHERRFKK